MVLKYGSNTACLFVSRLNNLGWNLVPTRIYYIYPGTGHRILLIPGLNTFLLDIPIRFLRGRSRWQKLVIDKKGRQIEKSSPV